MISWFFGFLLKGGASLI